MNLLVTGGAGFIGSNFIYYMMNKYKDCNIICVDKLTYASNISVLKPIINNQRFIFKKADICDRKAMEEVFENFKPDKVVNFAAESHVDRSIENPDIFLKSNILGVGVLLECCVKYGNIRFHQISTDEVYGDLDYDDTQKFDEKSPLCPSSPYSASKSAADMLVLSYNRTYGLSVTITRSVNNYGKFQHTEKLIPCMVTKALRGENLPVYGDGRNVREWVNAIDHCSAVDLVLTQGEIGGIYNVGGVEVRNIDLVKKICKILEIPESMIEYVTDRPGHDRKYATDCSKLYNLGWRESINFEYGLEDTVKWYTELKK